MCIRCTVTEERWHKDVWLEGQEEEEAVNISEQRVQAIYADKHAPDTTPHSTEDSHVHDEAKLPRNDKTTALACSPDFFPPAPEKTLNTAAVSSPRDEPGRKGASLRLRESETRVCTA